MPINRVEIEHYKGLELLAKKVVEGFITGLHKSPFHGFSVEFAEHRLYNTGESTRQLRALLKTEGPSCHGCFQAQVCCKANTLAG